ncbi:SRPBCC family protein [Arthrobacter sp. Ld5]|uniref:SRPBCC family protein n=1 Tax=Arthrobacter sp. Ld5 TaxID=649152 RepID=UPI003EB81399
MNTIPNVPYRLEFSVEVPGAPEQVWQAIATAKGMSAWFLPTEMEEREGGSLHFSMGPEMGSDGHVTRWDPPRRIVYEEDWATLMGKDPDALSPLTSEFLVEAQSGGSCVVRVTSSGFGTGAAWESEFWEDMGANWMPFFDNLRLYLTHFPGQEATQLEATASHPGDADTLWSTLQDALALGTEGTAVEIRGATGRVERVGERQALIRLTAPVPAMLSVFAYGESADTATAGARAYVFSADAADYVRREEPAWQDWLQQLEVPVLDAADGVPAHPAGTK